MDFKAALAIVVREKGDLYDYKLAPNNGASDDLLPISAEMVPVPAAVWRVLRFIDYGSVEKLALLNGSRSPLTVARDAAGTFDYRAATCAASFLDTKFAECEVQVITRTNLEYVVPFFLDHYDYARQLPGVARDSYSFEEACRCSYGGESVRGLYTIDTIRVPLTPEGIFRGALWEHNRCLMEETVVTATRLETFNSMCGLVWTSARDVATWLKELVRGDSLESVELRKDARSLALVRLWICEMTLYGRLGAKVIFLTDSLRADASAIRMQNRYL